MTRQVRATLLAVFCYLWLCPFSERFACSSQVKPGKTVRQEGVKLPQKIEIGAKDGLGQNRIKNGTGFDPVTANGVLNEIAGPLARILKFKRKGERLAVDLPGSYAEADGAFREIRTKARGGGGGHGSGNFWNQYVSGQNFAGRIQKGEQNFGAGAFGGERKPRPERYVVEFLESIGNACELEVQGESPEQFVIRINGGFAPYFLQIIQDKNGFSVQEVDGLTAFAGRGSSFAKFCQAYPDFVQQRLLPILKRFGFSTPATRYNSVTRDHVLVLLSPVDQELLGTFKEEFKNLESTNYDQRQAATKKLNDEYENWEDVIRFAVGSGQFGIEIRSRLQKLIKEKSNQADRELIQLVTSADLVNDTEYLVWLLGNCRENALKQHVVDKLKKLTEKDFGLDTDAWKKWVIRSSSAEVTPKENEVNKRLAEAEGYLPQMAQPTSNLLRLKTEGGKIVLDKQNWSDQFNGESIKTLVTRVQSELKKSNLPTRWLKSGQSGLLDLIRHEHVLFEHIQSAIPPQMSSRYSSYGNLSGYQQSKLNRKVEQPHLLLRLNLEEQKRTDKFGRRQVAKNKPNLFNYAVRERRDWHTVLSLTQHQDSSFCLHIANRESRALFQFFQDKEGKVACHYLVGGTMKSISAASFSELYVQNGEYLAREIYPLFARFGIQVTKEMGGPLEIRNAPRPDQKSRL